MRSISDITAAILVGGFGTRLQPVVSDRPKVLAEVGGRPFLTYLLGQVSSAGVRRAVLCTGYMAEQVKEVLGEVYGTLSILYSEEVEPLGTGGALRLALPHLSDVVLVMNGDSYVDADLGVFVDWFFRKGCEAAILLTKVGDTARYGRVAVENDGSITAFEEKGASSGPGWINAGVYLMKRSLIASIPADRTYSLERELFPALAGGGLFGFCAGGQFIDIGTPASYTLAEEFFGVESSEDFERG